MAAVESDRRGRRVRSPLSAVAAGPGCLVFLWTYAAVHLAYERGVDVSFVRAIVAIPLCATLLLGVAVAAVASMATAVVLRASNRPVPSTPRLLLASIVLFGAIIILFP